MEISLAGINFPVQMLILSQLVLIFLISGICGLVGKRMMGCLDRATESIETLNTTMAVLVSQHEDVNRRLERLEA